MIKFIFGNFWTKIMALVLALLVWGHLYSESTESKEQDVSFFLEGLKQVPDIAILRVIGDGATPIFTYNTAEESTGLVKIRITGSKGTIKSLVKKGIECRVKLDPKMLRGKKDKFSKKITSEDFNLPGDINIKVLPSEDIVIEYTKFETRDVNLDISEQDLEGNPAHGFKVFGIQAHPNKIKAKIPSDKSIESVRIEKIKIDGRVEPFSVKPNLRKQEFPIHPLEEFEARINIQPIPDEKEFSNVPFSISIPQDTSPFRIILLEPKVLSVKFTGPSKILERIGKEQIQITMQCPRVPTDKEPVVNANLQVANISISGLTPSDISQLKILFSPAEVQIKLEKSK